MTNMDEEARSLITLAAETITPDSVPRLRLPEPAHALPSARPRIIRVRRWLAPAAAGVAVLAIILAAAIVAGRPHARRAAGQPDSAVPEGIPAYYIAMTASQPARRFDSPQFAGIYSTATGKLVARITPPTPRGSSESVIAVSAAADDRTFLLTVADPPSVQPQERQFYLAKFDPATRQVSLAPVPASVPAQALLEAVALSPDGTKIAYALTQLSRPNHFELTIVDLKTLRSRTWASSSMSGGTPDFQGLYPDPTSLSWANNNTTLAFNWRGPLPALGSKKLTASGVRLLDTAEPGDAGGLVADSHLSLPFARTRSYPEFVATSAGYLPNNALLATDGRNVVAGIRSFSNRGCGFDRFSAVSGRLEGTADRGPCTRPFDLAGTPTVLWTGATGRTLVVMDPPDHPGQIGVVHGNQLTLLPKPRGVDFPLAAW
jgi:hypothetical protein